jgi:hypothetical protein
MFGEFANQGPMSTDAIPHSNTDDLPMPTARDEVIDAARRPGRRLAEILQILVEGYADRPALGQRARKVVLDPTTGRTATRLLPSFETISYGDLWMRVRAVAAAWRRDEKSPVHPGDFVATVGFASPDYLTVDALRAAHTAVRHSGQERRPHRRQNLRSRQSNHAMASQLDTRKQCGQLAHSASR